MKAAHSCWLMLRKVSKRRRFNEYLKTSMTWRSFQVLNKVDMESAMIDEVSDQVIDLLLVVKKKISSSLVAKLV